MRAAASTRIIVVFALLLFFALAVHAALLKAPTNDEPVHLTRGILLAQSNDLALQGEHTPLSHRLIGLLAAGDRSVPPVTSLPSWGVGDRLDVAADLLWSSGVDVDRVIFLGRLPIILLALLLASVVALWTRVIARQLAGEQGAAAWPAAELAALAVVMGLFAFSSNLLASAAVATTDMAATTTYLAAVCAWWFYWQQPSPGRWALAAVLLGLGLSAKLTGVLLVPLLLPLAYVYRRSESWWRPAAVWLALLPVAGLVVWAVYGFELDAWLGLTLPAASYWESLVSVLTHVDEGHQAFFLGQLASDGWWSYFPVALLLKTPLAVLGLLLAAIVVIIIRWRATWPVAVFTLLPAAALLAAAAASRLNIGYRHILPALPFLLVAIGLAVPWLWRRRVGRWALGGAVVWVAAGALWLHPHHLAFFNELVGGPAHGYRYLGDSNLDWGQDLRQLAEQEGLAGYSYAGSADPAYYGVDRPPLEGPEGTGSPGFSPANPAPGQYAISANRLQGLLPESDLFNWFWRREPDGSLGYSILLYNVENAAVGEWIGHCLAPGPLLEPEAAEQLLGVAGLRHLYFDCAQSWIWPDDGAPGWIILPQEADLAWVLAQMPDHQTGQLTAVYTHRASALAPDYTVVYWSGAEQAGWVPPARPATTGSGEQVTLPVELGETVILEAYAQTGTDWLTLWRVTAVPEANLSLQAHLIGQPDAPPLVADGLGFSSDQWQPGDWFMQRHELPEGATGDYLLTGLYEFQTLEPVGRRLRLPAGSNSPR